MTIDEITTKPYRVLSLDGGGMRGLYTASLLNTLSDRFGNQLDVGKGFDLIVGTSTGSILAAGLVAGIPQKSHFFSNESLITFGIFIFSYHKEMAAKTKMLV